MRILKLGAVGAFGLVMLAACGIPGDIKEAYLDNCPGKKKQCECSLKAMEKNLGGKAKDFAVVSGGKTKNMSQKDVEKAAESVKEIKEGDLEKAQKAARKCLSGDD
jgi:hypothetical protein